MHAGGVFLWRENRSPLQQTEIRHRVFPTSRLLLAAASSQQAVKLLLTTLLHWIAGQSVRRSRHNNLGHVWADGY